MTPNSPYVSSRYYFLGIVLAIIFGAAIVGMGIACAVAIWEMSFEEQRITRPEWVVGSIATATCVAISLWFLLDGDPLTFPLIVASLFVMGKLVMTDRPSSEERMRKRLRALGPLMYIGKKPIDGPPRSEPLPK